VLAVAISGIVMAFQLGTNLCMLAERTGSIQGPLPSYKGFTV
jgi:cytochrome d ubiquinol oxidase subunit I